MNTDALLPCECGGQAEMYLSSDGEATWAKCTQCGHEGGVSLSETEAIAAWNTRPSPPASDDALVEEVARVMHPKIWEVHDDIYARKDDHGDTEWYQKWCDASKRDGGVWWQSKELARAIIPIAQAPVLAQLATAHAAGVIEGRRQMQSEAAEKYEHRQDRIGKAVAAAIRAIPLEK